MKARRWQRMNGYPRAADKLLPGKAFDAGEALITALVSKVLPPAGGIRGAPSWFTGTAN